MRLEITEFKDIIKGGHFLVDEYGDGEYLSNWIKIDNSTAVSFGEARSFSLYDEVYYDYDKYLKELDEWEQSTEGQRVIKGAVEEAKRRQEGK